MTERERFDEWWDKTPRAWGYDLSVAWLAWQAAVASRPPLAASVARRAAYMGVEALRDEVARLKALLREARGCVAVYYGPLLARIDAALAPTDADRRGEDGEAVDAAGGGK